VLVVIGSMPMPVCNRFHKKDWPTTVYLYGGTATVYTEWAIKNVPCIILLKMLLHLFIWTK